MIAYELDKLRHSRAVWIGYAVALFGALGTGALLIGLRPAIDALIRLNDIIPNATDADRLSPDQLNALSFANPAVQAMAANLTGSGFGNPGIPALVVTILGIVAVTGEYRHGGIATTSLVTPRRGVALGHRAAALSATALVLSVLLVPVSIGVLAAGPALVDTSLELTAAQVGGTWLRSALVMVLLVLIGMSIGYLVRNQVAAVVLFFTWMLAEEFVRNVGMLLGGEHSVLNALPLGLAQDAVAAPLDGLPPGLALTASVAPWQALGLLAMWTALAVGTSALTYVRRDVEPG